MKSQENQIIIKESSKRWILLFLLGCLMVFLLLTYIFHLTKRIDSIEQSQERTLGKYLSQEAEPPEFNTILLELKENQYKKDQELTKKNKELIDKQLKINELLLNKPVKSNTYEHLLTSTTQISCLNQFLTRFEKYCKDTYGKETLLSKAEVSLKESETFYACNQGSQVKEVLRWSEKLVYLKCK